MGIRLDLLATTSVPKLTHAVAAIADGITVQLSVNQILSLLPTTNHAAKRDLDNATGPRGKYAHSVGVANADSLLENGIFHVASGSTNIPAAGDWIFVVYSQASSGLWVTQFAFSQGSDSSADSAKYKRERNNGTWTAWYRVRENEAELDARFLLKSNNLSDLPNKATARTNLDVPTLSNNLSDIPNKGAARANLSVYPSSAYNTYTNGGEAAVTAAGAPNASIGATITFTATGPTLHAVASYTYEQTAVGTTEAYAFLRVKRVSDSADIASSDIRALYLLSGDLPAKNVGMVNVGVVGLAVGTTYKIDLLHYQSNSNVGLIPRRQQMSAFNC